MSKTRTKQGISSELLGSGGGVAAAGAAFGALVSGNAQADVPATAEQSGMATVEITGTAIPSALSYRGNGPRQMFPATAEQSGMATVEITGTAISSENDISQSVDTIDKKGVGGAEPHLGADALRNVPGNHFEFG